MDKEKTPTSWAENEIDVIRKKKFNQKANDDDFEYMNSCYESALKAFKCLFDDKHNDMSIEITKSLFDRLVGFKPLTEITEDDFKDENGNWLVKTVAFDGNVVQCPRYWYLFKTTKEDGTVIYSDIDRYNLRLKGSGTLWSEYLDFMERDYPITLPYYPSTKPIIIDCEEFLINKDEAHSDFDVRHCYAITKEDGTKQDIDVWQMEIDGCMQSVSRGDVWEVVEKQYQSIYGEAEYKIPPLLQMLQDVSRYNKGE